MNKKSQAYIALAGLIFTLSMLVFFVYANYMEPVKVRNVELKKSSDLRLPEKNKKSLHDTIARAPTDSLTTDSTDNNGFDTASHKILLIGDSQVEGLRVPFYDYCRINSHELLLAATWYSGTDKLFASNDTLKNIIARLKPDYIVMVVGLNEIYIRDLDPCEAAVKKIIETFNGIPYAWIGPANWTADKGINDLYQRTIPSDCFFLSKDMVLPRAKDGRHPNETGNRIWMDSIATWMRTQAHWRIKMEKKDTIIRNRDINDWMQLAQ